MEYALLESQFELEALRIATLKESNQITDTQFNKLKGAKGTEKKEDQDYWELCKA